MNHGRVLAAAKEDQDAVIELTRALVRIPSRAGIDTYDPIIDLLSGWMREHGLATTVLRDGTGAVVGLTIEIRGDHPGPRWVLDACLDSAPFGDENAWTYPPTSGVIEDGWMWGRGSSDSKAAVAIFCHLATRLAASTERLHGSLVLLFDLDEHTGRFGGATRYFEGPDAPSNVAGVMIGYPGMDKLVIGGRGVHRAQLHVHGIASHSGGSRSSPNAIDKAAHLVRELAAVELPNSASEDFPVRRMRSRRPPSGLLARATVDERFADRLHPATRAILRLQHHRVETTAHEVCRRRSIRPDRSPPSIRHQPRGRK